MLGGIESEKAAARQRLHARLAVAANAYAGGDPEVEPDATRLRVASRIEPIGSLTGSGYTYAERWEDSPKLIFLISEHTPERGDVYSLAADIAYVVEAVEPRDGLTISARAARLSTEQASEYMPPDDGT